MICENDGPVEKIRKLLRLSQSPNIHEAGLALEMAARLARRHRISLAHVDPDAQIDQVCRRDVQEPRLHLEKERALVLIQNHFNLNVVRLHHAVAFIGRKEDIAIGEYVYVYSVRACRGSFRKFAAAEKAARRKMSATKRENFVYGFFLGIDHHLHELMVRDEGNPATFALVHDRLAVEKRRKDEFTATHLLGLKSEPARRPEQNNDAAKRCGFAEGLRTPVHRAVQESPAAQPMLLDV